jgi:type II restriction enzyme
MPTAGLDQYKSLSQRARVATEAWAEINLYCASCTSRRIQSAPHNNPVVDFLCPACRAPYQLKSRSGPIAARIVDAGYDQMCRAIREDRTPNLLVMHYDLAAWRVLNLILIPRFAFSEAAVEKRKPLSAGARRAGWIGCNILLGRIPDEARLPLIKNGQPLSSAAVRRGYRRIKPLAAIEPQRRGWTLDVLAAVRSLGKQSFTLDEVYSLEPSLAELHPDNRHVRDKIRQQLQLLRDVGLLSFTGGGTYRLT